MGWPCHSNDKHRFAYKTIIWKTHTKQVPWWSEEEIQGHYCCLWREIWNYLHDTRDIGKGLPVWRTPIKESPVLCEQSRIAVAQERCEMHKFRDICFYVPDLWLSLLRSYWSDRSAAVRHIMLWSQYSVVILDFFENGQQSAQCLACSRFLYMLIPLSLLYPFIVAKTCKLRRYPLITE